MYMITTRGARIIPGIIWEYYRRENLGSLGEFYRSFARSIDLQKSFGGILSILTCQRTSAHPWTHVHVHAAIPGHDIVAVYSQM